MKDRQVQYFVKIVDKLQEIFNEEQITIEELSEDGAANDFMYALSCMASTQIYNKLTGDDLGCLDFNYIANKLCVQNLNN